MPRKRQLVTAAEAQVVKSQRNKPCSDCPWARAALPGWLGSCSVDEWLQYAHGEALVDCHTEKFVDPLDPDDADEDAAAFGPSPQCAGIAIYRANVAKKCYSKEILALPPDRELVFATPMEFREHHTLKKKCRKTNTDRA